MPADEAIRETIPTVPAVKTAEPVAAPGGNSRWPWLAVLFALGLVVPFLPVPNLAVAIAGAVVLVAVYVFALVQFVAQTTRLRLSSGYLTMWFGISLAWWIALTFGLIPQVIEPFNDALRAHGGQPFTSQLMIARTVRTLADLALLCAAVLGGSLIAPLIKTPNMLGPICTVIALIDIWGVLFGGIVSQMMEKAPEVSAKAMSAVPSMGGATGAAERYAIPALHIGAGDYLFLGLLFAALHLNKMDWRGAVRLTTPLVIIALLCVTFVGPLPGLPFIGLGVALPNLKYFEYTREEKFALLYAAVFVVILTIGLYFGITSMLPATK